MTREEAIEILRAKAVDIPIGWETFQRAQGVKVKTIRTGHPVACHKMVGRHAKRKHA